MTKIDIFSGFLGAGKTTLIKKLISEAYAGEKLVIIENEFGETGIDGGFLKDSGIQINEMNSGCICCSLVGDFTKALTQVLDEYNPDRILIEPSGVGKLSDVIRAVSGAQGEKATLGSAVTVVDANKCRMYAKNFGEFFIDQVENAGTIILSRTADISEDKLAGAVKLLREHNENATIITTDWDKLSGKQILCAMEETNSIEKELEEMTHEHEHEHCHCHEHEHDHEHHHEHGENCDCGCHGHHHEYEHEQDHEHDHEHEHEHECHHDHGHEHHHHEHAEECTCGCHEHHHHDHEHGHHHADDIFSSWGSETVNKYAAEEIEKILCELDNTEEYGMVLRAKGIVALNDGSWAHFDYVPGEHNVRIGSAEITGKICVIGSGLKEEKLPVLFKI